MLLPTLNEEENIVLQIREILKVFPKIGRILILDDASTDRTTHLVRQVLPGLLSSGQVQILSRTGPFGLAHALAEGIRLSNFRYTGWMDCDLSMPTEVLPSLLKSVTGSADLCLGSRFLPGGGQKSYLEARKDSRLEIFLSTFGNAFLKKVFKVPCTDFTSGFCIGKTDSLKKLRWSAQHGEYFIQMLVSAHRMGYQIEEIPYQCGTRRYGKSKTSQALVRNSLRVLRTMLRLLREKNSSLRPKAFWRRVDLPQTGT